MNFGPPTWVVEAAETALRNVPTNHYAHPKGALRLRNAIKNFYGPQLNRDLNPDTEILVSSGANEGNYP
jgi:kynurenine aminotransferase